MEKKGGTEGYSVQKKREELAKVLHYYGLLEEFDNGAYKIMCPFHDDLRPSMKINMEDGSFKCFGCEVSGEAKDFVKLANAGELNDLQALVEFYRILKSDEVKNLKVADRKNRKKQNKFIHDMAYDFYFGLRTVDWENDEDEEVIKSAEYMEKRGFSRKILNQCKAKVTYQKNYPIVFPMYDGSEFRGWVCRTTNKEIEKKRKYLYNEGFSRSTTLVGHYKGSDRVVVVEGYMDRLRVRSFGEKRVVAVLGWKMTANQIEKLKKQGVKEIISFLDNDKCGRKGTEFLGKFFEVKRPEYPNGVKDPGEMDRKTFKRMMRSVE